MPSFLQVPRALGCWWVLQNDIDPTSYPLPQGLQHCPILSVGDDPDWCDQLISAHGDETPLGAAVRQAWEHITAVDRELMLLCWAGGRRNYYDEHVLGPKPIFGSAFDMIDRDLIGDSVSYRLQ
ncbi:hypothetical protein PILCRDRAFT_815536 [Piloderma croceum F 1598]|uniref:Uncharacterized protein n=1 Tax=Piloderma croceum (strain F 1598) TaxID=765440 RepID=A0A0C3FSB0_PILCF|nr:hypothetical protein PILCRDRAFT_815536 [Piloderma croceum F 1598]